MSLPKKLDIHDYLDLVTDFKRDLFQVGFYEIVDGLDDIEQNYFIINHFYSNPPVYQISLRDCYELLAMKVTGVAEKEIIDYIEEIIEDVE